MYQRWCIHLTRFSFCLVYCHMEIILNNLAKRYLVDISNSAEKHEHGKFANIRFKFHPSPSLSILFPNIPPPLLPLLFPPLYQYSIYISNICRTVSAEWPERKCPGYPWWIWQDRKERSRPELSERGWEKDQI